MRTTSGSCMEELHNTVEETARSFKLSFKPPQVCDTAPRAENRSQSVMEQEGSYFHFGIPTGVSIDQTPYNVIRELIDDLNAVSASLLAPWRHFCRVLTLCCGLVRKSPL